LQNNYAGALADLNKAIDICPNKLLALSLTLFAVQIK